MTYDPIRLKDLRISRRLTQKRVAELLGISQQNYQYYEKPKSKGGYAPKGGRMAKLAGILLVSEAYLRGETDDPTPKSEDVLTEDELEVVRAWRSRDLKRLNELFVQQARKDMGK